eukprot:CAMPEP_0115010520 /NCGR_PEP_ID=MMETSP0216-20121206/23365_1 /TAXON_ID=223996 /ORGANISM="Protocruzia adherens, Strain Boccale" /LENGTH=218 /DNA_ID=CAMNT_0002378751 /DNA_START=519 /DNA_END=1175 /DNA_ORIENTATION=+
MLCLLAICGLLAAVTAQDMSCSDVDATYVIGDDIKFCMAITVGSNVQQGKKIVFNAVVDEYTVFQAQGAFSEFYDLAPVNSSIYLKVANGKPSVTRAFLNGTGYATLYNAIVSVDNGKIEEIYWDNDCYNCTTSAGCESVASVSCCIDKVCYANVERNKCRTDNFKCDPKVYVTWVGTDANGDRLTSAGLAMSRFTDFAVTDMYSSAEGVYDKESSNV